MANSAPAAEREAVKWFLVFFHDGERDETEGLPFPEVEFWQDNREAAEREGKRVLLELRARGDCRNWTAAAYPDPFAIARGEHRIAQWLLHTNDIAGRSQAV